MGNVIFYAYDTVNEIHANKIRGDNRLELYGTTGKMLSIRSKKGTFLMGLFRLHNNAIMGYMPEKKFKHNNVVHYMEKYRKLLHCTVVNCIFLGTSHPKMHKIGTLCRMVKMKLLGT